jgi:hypothetical protein
MREWISYSGRTYSQWTVVETTFSRLDASQPGASQFENFRGSLDSFPLLLFREPGTMEYNEFCGKDTG